MSDINEVERVEYQISRESELMDSGDIENQGNVKKVISCKTEIIGENEMNEVDDEDGILSDFSDLSDISPVFCDQVYSLDEINSFFG